MIYEENNIKYDFTAIVKFTAHSSAKLANPYC